MPNLPAIILGEGETGYIVPMGVTPRMVREVIDPDDDTVAVAWKWDIAFPVESSSFKDQWPLAVYQPEDLMVTFRPRTDY